ncbi:hypothetical protein [Brasilonema bromeliae]|nr:hypothetical protein [Brasilonema bromeliae]
MVQHFAEFYLTSNRDYGQMKAYIRMLDYLRLLIIEYLQTYQSPQPQSA